MENTNIELKTTTENKSQLNFFEKVKKYTKEGYPHTIDSANGKVGFSIVLKPEYGEEWQRKNPDEYRNEILNEAKKVNAKQMNAISFIVDDSESDVSAKSFYLHECDIEDGGPQPRTEINPSDPETQTLFELIKANGQAIPINVYPSPTTQGKYRIAEGHRRRMVIFNMLRQDSIWVVSEQRSELKAHEDAFDLNNARKNLSATDQGRFFQTLMKKFPTVYPNQKAIAERRKLTPAYVSYVLSSTALVDEQKNKISKEMLTQVNRLPEHTIRPVSKIAAENKSVVLTAIVENKLTSPQAEKLVETVNANPEPTPEFVAVEAQKIADAKAVRYMKEADKEKAKTKRARDKVVAAGEEYPQALMTTVFGHLGLKNKGTVDPETAKAFAKDVVDILVNRAIEADELDSALAEADLWKK